MFLTRDLLNSGALNHLSDTELSRVQWLLLKRNPEQAESLMHYWYFADFLAEGVPQFLMYECNLLLQCAGKRGIDWLMEAQQD